MSFQESGRGGIQSYQKSSELHLSIAIAWKQGHFLLIEKEFADNEQ
jgi:hypothetical protein